MLSNWPEGMPKRGVQRQATGRLRVLDTARHLSAAANNPRVALRQKARGAGFSGEYLQYWRTLLAGSWQPAAVAYSEPKNVPSRVHP